METNILFYSLFSIVFIETLQLELVYRADGTHINRFECWKL